MIPIFNLPGAQESISHQEKTILVIFFDNTVQEMSKN